MKPFHRLAAFIAALAMLAGLAGNAMAQSVSISEIRIFYSAASHIASAKGLYTSHGLQALIKPVNKGSDVTAMLLGGAADAGTIAPTPILAAPDSDLVILGTMLRSDKLATLVSFEDIGITADPASVKNLKGKTVGVTPGTNGVMFLSFLLERGDLTMADIRPVYASPQELALLIGTGKLDAAVIWEPATSVAKTTFARTASGERKMVAQSYEGIHTLRFNLVAHQADVEKNPELYQRLVAALIDAGDFLEGKSPEVRTELASWLGLPADMIGSLMNASVFNFSLNVPLMKEQLDLECRQAHKDHLFECDPSKDLSGHIYPEILRAVAPTRVIE